MSDDTPDPLEELALHRVVSVTLDADENLTLDHEGVSYYEALGMLVGALFHHVLPWSDDPDDD